MKPARFRHETKRRCWFHQETDSADFRPIPRFRYETLIVTRVGGITVPRISLFPSPQGRAANSGAHPQQAHSDRSAGPQKAGAAAGAVVADLSQRLRSNSR